MKTDKRHFHKNPDLCPFALWMTALLIFFSMMDARAQSAPTAQFNSIELQHNVMHNGEKCLKLITDVNVRNAKGKDVKFIAYVECPKGEGHRDTNGRYCTTDDKVSFSKVDEATYDNTRWKTLTLYLPNSEVHPMTGKNTYYIQVCAWVDGKTIGRSDYVSFSMEGGSMARNSGQGNSNGNRNASAGSNAQKITCFICKGTGKCGICGGLGYTVSPYGYLAGQPVACGYCSTSGNCPACFGKGYNISEYKNGATYIDGKPYYPNGSNSSGSSSSSNRKNNRNSSSSCSLCGGTGVNKTPNSGGSRASWVIYYNSEGSDCPYCNSRTKHFHDRCARCNVPSY